MNHGLARVAALGLVLFCGIASVASATSSKPKAPSDYCHVVYSTCMFNGTALRVCSDRLQACRSGTLTPVIGQTAAGQEAGLLAALAERNAPHAVRFEQMTDVAFTGGSTYCLKMLRACDAGNYSACERFDRYCQPAD